jgi:hypothetical protein
MMSLKRKKRSPKMPKLWNSDDLVVNPTEPGDRYEFSDGLYGYWSGSSWLWSDMLDDPGYKAKDIRIFHELDAAWNVEEKEAKDSLTLDPNDPFECVLIEMVATNRKKRADYANSSDIFANFRRSAGLIGLAGFGPKEAVLFNIAQKLARLQALRENGRINEPMNETVEDTYLDLAVYGVLLLALSRDEK